MKITISFATTHIPLSARIEIADCIKDAHRDIFRLLVAVFTNQFHSETAKEGALCVVSVCSLFSRGWSACMFKYEPWLICESIELLLAIPQTQHIASCN